MTDMYAPDWCEQCGWFLAMPRYTIRHGFQVREPLVCPVCASDGPRSLRSESTMRDGGRAS